MNSDWNDDDEDDGLPDAAFTEDELAAGVQHMMRTGDSDAAFSMSGSLGTVENEHYDCAEDMDNVRQSLRKTAPVRFQTFAQAQAWSIGPIREKYSCAQPMVKVLRLSPHGLIRA